MPLDPVYFNAETFSALVDAQHSFVASLLAVLSRAQRQALSQELTAHANRAGHPMTYDLLQQWAHRAKQQGEALRG